MGTAEDTRMRRRIPVREEDRPIIRVEVSRLTARRVPADNMQRRLCDAVAKRGVTYPLLVRADGSSGRFTVVDGARRLHAAIANGISALPCFLESSDDAAAAYTEKIRRAEGLPFIQADFIAEMLEVCSMTQQEAANRLGISQSTVANKLRLRKLSREEQEKITALNLSERHARALLALPGERRGEALVRIERGSLTVAATETLIEQMSRPKRRAAIRDIGIFYNSIDRALSILHNAGVTATLDREESDDGVRVVICVSRETS